MSWGFRSSRDCADYLLLNAQIREYEAGEVIINGGSVGDSFCVLQSGNAFICGQILADGHYNTLATLDAGACFGEMSIICNEPTSNTVIAGKRAPRFSTFRARNS